MTSNQAVRPQTIQIFLPHGDPRGIRIAELTTRIVQIIEVPRKLLPEFVRMPESEQVALYFLFGGADDGAEPRVYIGQTGDLRQRLAKHHREKEFWERALVLISRTNSLTNTHALFLEWLCVQSARRAGRYGDENGNSGSRPHTPAPLEADCLEIYDTGRTLLATLGFPLFEPVAKPSPAASTETEDEFVCTATGARGRGLYTEEGFVVLAGSVGRLESVPSIIGTAGGRLRERLLESGAMEAQGDKVVFRRDHLFRSPSMAALALLGRTANGWLEWKTADGRTLDAVRRQQPLV
ncbi:MAG: GIY-YIG nuclease family protein [Ramlibacter sp.]|nr:GIY-YIG nuclease family protein [Ramlibacter sp.]